VGFFFGGGAVPVSPGGVPASVFVFEADPPQEASAPLRITAGWSAPAAVRRSALLAMPATSFRPTGARYVVEMWPERAPRGPPGG
jgi:hypothetical protein